MMFTTVIQATQKQEPAKSFIFLINWSFTLRKGEGFPAPTKHVQQNKNAFRRGCEGYFSLFLTSLSPLAQVTGVSTVDQLTDQQFY